eukprot:TRINITY_DN306_c2_g1_i1.p1 TRINITY_DN306_c2_g1~~TRINITY_DN306_c2_g1_i1.p1  ORF type:complete len:412 (-),score=139.05 TRINITY_DN306_c2_g1_i1:140-1258(-)
MAKNKRQAYGISLEAAHQGTGLSWGTGRAVSRVPRVKGGGTRRTGQATQVNQARGGRMYTPNRTWRKWHRRVNQNQRRYAVVSAIAATAVPALVMARGHNIESVPEIPLVVSDDVQNFTKTKEAVKQLCKVGAYNDVEKSKNSKKLRRGKGKMRNRRNVQRRGPLVVYGEDNGIVKAFRNLPGVELCQVERLNLLQLAPGAHLGRFVVWTASAFAALDKLYAPGNKKGFVMPSASMNNPNLAAIINSDSVQAALRPKKTGNNLYTRKKNPLKNLQAMIKLNPYSKTSRRIELLKSNKAARKATAKEIRARKAAGKAFFREVSSHEDWREENRLAAIQKEQDRLAEADDDNLKWGDLSSDSVSSEEEDEPVAA